MNIEIAKLIVRNIMEELTDCSDSLLHIDKEIVEEMREAWVNIVMEYEGEIWINF